MCSQTKRKRSVDGEIVTPKQTEAKSTKPKAKKQKASPAIQAAEGVGEDSSPSDEADAPLTPAPMLELETQSANTPTPSIASPVLKVEDFHSKDDTAIDDFEF